MTPTTDKQPPPDSDWIREVLQQHERHLILYAARMIGDVERARDVVQEAFLRLCNQDRETLEDRVDVWLFTVTRNLCHDAHRKESRMTPLEVERATETACAEATPAASAEAKDEFSFVMASIDCLPPKQREVLRLKFQHGLSYKEISRVTQESMGNVGWLLHTAMANLRKKLATTEIRGAEA